MSVVIVSGEIRVFKTNGIMLVGCSAIYDSSLDIIGWDVVNDRFQYCS
jgi:hypothetical protein